MQKPVTIPGTSHKLEQVADLLNTMHNRALDAHQISLQALFDLWIEAFFKENPTLYQKCMSSMETVREACSNGLDVMEAHHQLVRTTSIPCTNGLVCT